MKRRTETNRQMIKTLLVGVTLSLLTQTTAFATDNISNVASEIDATLRIYEVTNRGKHFKSEEKRRLARLEDKLAYILRDIGDVEVKADFTKFIANGDYHEIRKYIKQDNNDNNLDVDEYVNNYKKLNKQEVNYINSRFNDVGDCTYQDREYTNYLTDVMAITSPEKRQLFIEQTLLENQPLIKADRSKLEKAIEDLRSDIEREGEREKENLGSLATLALSTILAVILGK